MSTGPVDRPIHWAIFYAPWHEMGKDDRFPQPGLSLIHIFCYHCGVPGGTAYTVRYAKSKGVPIQNLAEEGPEQLHF